MFLSQPAFTRSKSVMKNIRTICEIYFKLTIKTLERRCGRRSGVLIAYSEQISLTDLVV